MKKRPLVLLFVLFAGTWFLMGCAHWIWEEEKKEAKDANDPIISEDPNFQPIEEDNSANPKAANVRSAKIEELELKIAKLWSRMDEIEEVNYRQKERLKLLEKGLLLGIVPEEMKDEDLVLPAKKAKKRGFERDLSEKEISIDADVLAKKKPEELANLEKVVNAESAATATAKVEEENFIKKMAIAEEHFKARRYGRAVVEYSAIGKEFSEKVTEGVHLYWLGRSWANLKEYETAKQHFSDFIEKFSAHPWVPKAKVELAKTEISMGLKETAVRRLGEVIERHPHDDAAELAKTELEKLQQNF